MENLKLITSSRRLMALAALATGVALPPQSIMAASTTQVVQQSGVVKGQVLDPSGEPVIGATVKVKGSKTGTVTDLDGNFSLSAAPGAMVEVSYIGYKTMTVKAGNGPLNVTLEDDNQALSEVVVVGFGTQKKVNLTGAVSVIDSKEIASRPVANATQALQGLVPGLQISSSSGSMDATPNVNVRGTTTIGEGSKGTPLILIDGSEGDLNTINPQDIESVSVLKDAAASSIYGSRAPFGVILVTTKKGKSGKVTVNYNNSFRFSGMIRGKHMMNSVDYAAWVNDAHTNGGSGVFFDQERMDKIVAYHNATPVGPGTRKDANGNLLYGIDSSNGTTWNDGYGYGVDDVDWYDALYKSTAFSQEHNASVSGGNDKFNFYASFNYLHNGGFMKLDKDKNDRYNTAAKIGAQITDWLHLDYSTRWTRTDFQRPATLTNSLYQDLARQGWPVLPLQDRNGYYYSSPSPALGLATAGKDTKERDILNQQVNLLIEPIKNWRTHIDFTYRSENTARHWDKKMLYNHDVAGNPIVYDKGSNVHEDEYKENYYNFQAYTEYNFSLAKKHNFHVMGGFQAEQLKKTEFGLQRNGVLDESRLEVDLTNGLSYEGKEIVPSVNGGRNQWQTAGFFGRLNYNYDEKYLFEFNIRHDGTSKFRRNNMWKTFPSFSLGWNIAHENFWKPLENTVNTLKLRASYGSLGNQNIDNWYQTYSTVAYKSVAGTWLQGGKKTNITAAPGLVSAALGWEKVESYDIGFDWGAFNNRLTGSFDYYVRNTKDMVGPAPELPALLGTAVPKTNNTDLRTTGWELQIGWRDHLENGLNYGVTFNVSDAQAKVTRYPNNPTGSLSSYIENRKVGEIWGYETIGIAKTNDEMNKHLATLPNGGQSQLGDKWAAGDIMYKDLDGDGKISNGSNTLADHGDLKVIGNNTPRYLFGLDLTASWKGFDFRAFMQGVMKRDYNVNGSWGAREYLFGATNSGVWWAAGITGVQDYFRDSETWSVKNGYESENLDAYLPRPQYSEKNIHTQTRYLLNAAYLRMKNLQVGYTLPQSLVSKAGLGNVRFFVSAENLFTITDLPSQFDPETIDTAYGNGYPLSRTFSFGVNVTL